jgi:hypothetical protein
VENILSEEEQEELVALKNAINYNPATVHPDKQERFTELFVKTLAGKGETSVFLDPTNF